MTITIQRLMQVLTALLLYACTLLLILLAKLQSHVVICTRILDDDWIPQIVTCDLFVMYVKQWYILKH